MKSTQQVQTSPAWFRLWSQHWVGICAVALILASETKFVLKDQVTGATANLDIYIVMEVAVYAAIGGFLAVRITRSPSRARALPLEMGLAALVFLMAVSVPFAPSPIYAAVRVLEMLVLLMLARAAIAQGPTGWFVSFAKVFVIATGAMVAIGVLVPGVRGPLQQERFNWLATHPVVVGQFLALAAVASLVLAVGRQWRVPLRRPPVLWWGLTAVFGVGLAANNTRGAASAAAVGAVVALVLVLPKRLWPSAVLCFAYAGVLLLLTSSASILDWLARGEDRETLGTLNARLPLWRLAVNSVADSDPLFGFGVGASRSIFLDATGLGGAHNAVINVIVDLGVVGLCVWAWLIAYSTWVAARAHPANDSQAVERALWLGTMVVLLVNGVTAEGLGGVANVGMGWLFILVARAAQVTQRRSMPPARTKTLVDGEPDIEQRKESPDDRAVTALRGPGA